jgi:hypothetical protein
MTKTRKSKRPKNEIRGPKPDLLKIEGNWKDAMKKSLQKRNPLRGGRNEWRESRETNRAHPLHS